MSLTRAHLQHRHKAYDIFVREDGALELYLDHCLRKRRDRSDREPQYVWTNVELEWEEHHYIEVRYWATTGKLRVTVNGDEVDGAVLAPAEAPNWLL